MEKDMKNTPNKMQSADTTKGVDLAQQGAEKTAYHFPDYQCTIYAESRESALKQLREKFPDADIEQ